MSVQSRCDLPSLLLVATGQEEVLAAGRKVRREPATDIARTDDGYRGVGDVTVANLS